MVKEIAREIRSNERLRAHYPELQAARITADRIELPSGYSLHGYAVGSQVRGRKVGGKRITKLIIDDPQGPKDIISPLYRRRAWDWVFKDAIPACDPSANVFVFATDLHQDSIAHRLRTTPGWVTRVYQSIVRWPDRMDLWKQWSDIYRNTEAHDYIKRADEFFEVNKVEMLRGGEALWPDRYPIYWLMRERVRLGEGAFASEYLNDPRDPSLSEWPAEYFDWPGFWVDRFPAAEQITQKVLSIDPSLGRESDRGDYSAICRYALDKRGISYIQVDQKRRNTESLCSDIVRHIAEWAPDALVIETNQYQELILPILDRVAKESQVRLPPVEQQHNSTSKEVRIRRLGPDLSRHLVRCIRDPGTQLAIEQAMQFPFGSHDDGIDAWEMARSFVAAPKWELR
jgi:predicted phage terminase large subunit-like protein